MSTSSVVNAVPIVSLDDVSPEPRVVCIGFFDGVHRGHRAIIRRAQRVARRGGRGLPTLVVTFDRHPLATVRPDAVPPLLTTHDRRVELLADTGVDGVLPLEFSSEMATMEPDAFVERVLVDHLRVSDVVVGRNFRFGRRAAGDRDDLERLGRRHGYALEAVDLLHLAGERISSTAVRESLGEGDIAWAARALGRYPDIEGPVVRGDARGRELGFPTANLDIPAGIKLPRSGVYAALAHLPDGDVAAAAVGIGTRPQFDGEGITVEAYLLDRDVDLYGSRLRLELRAWLRDEARFDDVEALVSQMDDDVRRTRALLGDHQH